MNQPDAEEVQALLARWQAGSEAALVELLPMLYAELKVLARRQLRSEREDHTLQTTALVHEAYVRMVGQSPGRVETPRHFFAVAAKAMRQVLIDHARKVTAAKRMDPANRISLDSLPESWWPHGQSASGLIDLDEALQALESVNERAARVVELTVFAGIDQLTIAELLEVSTKTVERDWKAARLWLFNRLNPA